jgi:protein-tyrosine phosphatase
VSSPLVGMIDLHCHLHFGVDDGPRDADESLRLARALVAVGVRTVACTSHVRPDKDWMNTQQGLAERHARLDALLAREGVPLERVFGAEHYVADEVFGDLKTLAERAVPYGHSRWMLVETPYAGPPADLLGLLYGVRRAGFKVLLAHAERFPYLCEDDDLLDKLAAAGHLLQVNLGSLAGVYSRVQRKAAERLLKAGRVAVLAGDCHREEDVEPNLVDGLRAARKLVSDEVLVQLLQIGPTRILEDAAPEKVFG